MTDRNGSELPITVRQRAAISGRSSTPLHGHSNVGFTADSGPSLDDAVQRVVFRFVGCLPSTTDMSAGHKRMRAGVVQIPMEETAECSDAMGTLPDYGD